MLLWPSTHLSLRIVGNEMSFLAARSKFHDYGKTRTKIQYWLLNALWLFFPFFLSSSFSFAELVALVQTDTVHRCTSSFSLCETRWWPWTTLYWFMNTSLLMKSESLEGLKAEWDYGSHNMFIPSALSRDSPTFIHIRARASAAGSVTLNTHRRSLN